MSVVPLIRVFLSSPGDVNDERKAVLEALDRLPNRPAFRERVSFRVVAWDKPGADTPMLATMSPQAAIDAGLPRPSDCDIVVTIFWARMGTPFSMNGVDYLSGTHYELLDALQAKRPQTLIYHRTEKKLFEAHEKENQAQYERVQTFLKGDLFYAPTTKQILRGVNSYTSPADFREKFETHLEEVVVRLLQQPQHQEADKGIAAPQPKAGTVIDVKTTAWVGSPFPGLRSFTKEDAPIFFGRERETDELLRRVADNRCVAVIGASGSGKSSLVGAGLLPRLEANAISSETIGSKDWFVLRFTPGQSEHPFASLFESIIAVFEALRPSPFEIRRVRQQFVEDMLRDPATLCDTLKAALDVIKAPTWAEVLLFIDQFEELFTLAKPDVVAPFVAMLTLLTQQPKMRVVLTMRHDFVHRAIEMPELAQLLNLGTLHLAAPQAGALAQMIKRPAERANLEFEDGLPEQILRDTGDAAGALALMAYTLDELYSIAVQRGDRRLTFADYAALGGVSGAIGKRAEQTFARMPGTESEKAALLGRVFRELVEVDERGTATRQRCAIGRFDETESQLLHFFTDARLLVISTDSQTADMETDSLRPVGEGAGMRATVEVAHEALFRSWERLKDWISATQEDLILLRQVKNAAHDWQRKNRPAYLLWAQERLELVYAMQRRLQPTLSEVEQDFIEPEQERLYRELEKPETSHRQRFDIEERLVWIGDTRKGVGLDKNGLPDMLWLPVSGSHGKVEFEFGEFEVQPFYVAKYLLTSVQFQAFIDSGEYDDLRWWDKFPKKYQPQQAGNVRNGNANAPRDMVSWYQAMAFAAWLNAKFQDKTITVGTPNGVSEINPREWQIRLPTEWEWQWMAQNGSEAREYPWGAWDGKTLLNANTAEASINDRSTAVGMYPHGAAACGALDVAGNLWEWCLNDFNNPQIKNGYNNGETKILRGGSFANNPHFARSAYRSANNPRVANVNYGVRLVVASISSLR